MARYLQSGSPSVQNRSQRIAELSEQVAVKMKLSDDEVDQIRIAALLQGMQNLEITARAMRRAVGDLGSHPAKTSEHTFQGTDLAHSLGSKLSSALPLLLGRESTFDELQLDSTDERNDAAPFGSQIIQAASEYDAVITGMYDTPVSNPSQAILRLKNSTQFELHPAVLHAMEKVVGSSAIEKQREELVTAGS